MLAGGASRRMGSDKARLPHETLPVAVHLVGILEAAGLEAAIVRRGRPDGLPWIRADGSAVRVLYEDDSGPRHPLNGVLTAFADARDAVVVVPCDVPALGVETVRALVDRPCVAEGDRVHPLVAHLPFALVDRAKALAAEGGAARALVAELPRCEVPATELVDRNTPEGSWPLDRLRARLTWVSDADFTRIAKSERVRQAMRGVVDPSANRYALRP